MSKTIVIIRWNYSFIDVMILKYIKREDRRKKSPSLWEKTSLDCNEYFGVIPLPLSLNIWHSCNHASQRKFSIPLLDVIMCIYLYQYN